MIERLTVFSKTHRPRTKRSASDIYLGARIEFIRLVQDILQSRPWAFGELVENALAYSVHDHVALVVFLDSDEHETLLNE